MMKNKIILSIFLFLLSANHMADGMVVDRVYHPYVIPNEQSFEWRVASHDNDSSHQLRQRIGYGFSVSEYMTLDVFVMGERVTDDNYELAAYEAELRWMLTEQGEYSSDWGMLIELEKSKLFDAWEATAGVLMEKEFGRFSLTMNAFVIYEWGTDLKNEWESEFRLQHRYRWIPELQPAVEIYMGENYQGIGPAIGGIKRFDGQQQFKWEAGIIFEVGHSDQNYTARLALEYEF